MCFNILYYFSLIFPFSFPSVNLKVTIYNAGIQKFFENIFEKSRTIGKNREKKGKRKKGKMI
jgi:hypothetical protein